MDGLLYDCERARLALGRLLEVDLLVERERDLCEMSGPGRVDDVTGRERLVDLPGRELGTALPARCC